MAIYKLGDVCTYIEGYVNPPINKNEYFGGGIINWLKVSDLCHGAITEKTQFSLTNQGKKFIKKNNQIFKKGSIIWSKSGTVGNCSILGIETTANRGILNILPIKNKIKNKYLYYWLLKNRNKLKRKAVGAVIQHLYGPKLLKENILVPTLINQQKIIDIIEPYEILVFKYFQLIKINSVENCKNSLKQLIDIIEPLEIIIIKLKIIRKKIINFLKTNYYLSTGDNILLFNLIKIQNQKYNGEDEYWNTSCVSEMNYNYSKIIFLKNFKIPSRANLKLINNSFIISKLLGENKILYINKYLSNNKVFSTGFFNFTTKHNDHILGFLLSEEFKKMKKTNSTGTTMQAITKISFNKFIIKEPKNNDSYLTKLISTVMRIENKLNQLKTKSIKILLNY